MNLSRIQRLIKSAIAEFRLDLRGMTVLTEAATGYYALTPIIAALAGADRVYALARTTRYGTAEAVGAGVLGLAERTGAGGIEILTDRLDARISSADIVTNLGMLRPLDAPFLARLKPTAVIPLMWETWEFRPADLDLPECRRLGIPVLGTDEHRPELKIFTYVGHLSLKLLFEAGVEVFRSRVAVVGSGEFAEVTVASLRAAGAEVWQADVAVPFWERDVINNGSVLDAVCFVEHHSYEPLAGKEAPLTAEGLARAFPGLTVIHVCGNADRDALTAAGIHCVPDRFAPPGSMSVATDYAGPRPLIDLHTAGLRVGEVMARHRLSGLSREETEAGTLATEPLAQAFPAASCIFDHGAVLLARPTVPSHGTQPSCHP